MGNATYYIAGEIMVNSTQLQRAKVDVPVCILEKLSALGKKPSLEDTKEVILGKKDKKGLFEPQSSLY